MLGKYEVRRELGRGAMGVVYEGYDPLIKRRVALKTIRPEHLHSEDATAMLARFRREAQAAGRLSHPNIVPIYDYGEEAGLSYIAMEFVAGRELKASFDANERFRPTDVVRIMGQILAALDYSHRQGVVHRDIKPANIFLLDDGSVKVADFGIAHVESSSLTQVGSVLGTPSYMSPEQILGLPVDGRSDLFSAGVVLYQFLTGERPFTGSAATTMQKVLQEDPLPPSTLNVQVLPVMDAVVRKAMAKRAEARFQSAGEFADAMRAAAASTETSPASAASAETTWIAATGAPAAVAGKPAPAATSGRPGLTIGAGAQPTVVRGAPAPAPAPAAAAAVTTHATAVPDAAGSAPRQPRNVAALGALIAFAIVSALAAGWAIVHRPTDRPLRPRHPSRPPPRPPPLPPALPATRSRPSPSRRRAHRSSWER